MIIFRLVTLLFVMLVIGVISFCFSESHYILLSLFCFLCFAGGYLFDAITFLLKAKKGVTQNISNLHKQGQIDAEKLLLYEIANTKLIYLAINEKLWDSLYLYCLAKMEHKCGNLSELREIVNKVKLKKEHIE